MMILWTVSACVGQKYFPDLLALAENMVLCFFG